MLTLNLTKRTLINLCLLVVVLLCVAHQISAQITIGGVTITKPKRPNKPDTSQPDRTTPNTTDARASGENTTGAPEDVQTNPNAPPDYNANLNVGDQAVAVDRFREVKAVRIVGKSGAAYKVAELKSPDSVQWYSANSVYPYFDYRAFNEDIFTYERESFVRPYLPCYAKKHNLELVEVTDHGYSLPNYSSAEEARKTLQAEQPKLAELDAQLKKFGVAPNIFLPYQVNPAIASEIAAERDEYLKCAVGTEEDKPDIRLSLFLEDLKKAQSEAERYTPADFLYLVSAGGPSEQLLYAVSRRAREEWAKQWLKNPASRAEFDAEWDKLAAIATKKIPTYKPSAGSYQFRFPVGEKLLMGALKNPSSLKIFRIGTDTAGWEIQKDNDDNLPSYRYKTMKVYFRDPADDHPYCHVVSARIKQDYAGGGRYNSEIYRSSVSDEVFGCP